MNQEGAQVGVTPLADLSQPALAPAGVLARREPQPGSELAPVLEREEFLLVLPGCDLENAMARGNELREVVAGTPVVALDAEKSITVSMGVAVSECVGKDEVESLLSRADAGLYAAKEHGRNRVEHSVKAFKKRGAAQAHKK